MDKSNVGSQVAWMRPESISVSDANLAEYFLKNCEKFKHHTAYQHFSSQISFCELEQLAIKFSHFLAHDLSLAPGDKLAVMLPNLMQYPVVLFGALLAGVTIVNVNPLYTSTELLAILKHAAVSTIVIFDLFLPTLNEISEKTRLKHVITTALPDLLKGSDKYLYKALLLLKPKESPKGCDHHFKLNDIFSRPKASLQVAAMTHETIAFLQFTGGTTGGIKAAKLTHGNMLANIAQIAAWMEGQVSLGKELNMAALPFYHIFALTVNALYMHSLGAKNVVVINPRDITKFVKLLGKHPYTIFVGVNTLLNKLTEDKHFQAIKHETLKFTIAGGMAVHPNVAERWKTITGCEVTEGYGLTEASPVVCLNPVVNHHFNHSIGLPLPSTSVKLIGKTGEEVQPGEVGELWVKGPQVMKGYFQDSKATDEVLVDGWLHTGDLALQDEQGFVFIKERIKDLIIVSGFNVYPNEVEETLCLHPDISEAAAIGVPDEKCGEAIKVFVVTENKNLTRDSIKQWCANSLTNYKLPRYIEFIDELPKNNVGKILRRKLRNEGEL